MTAMEWLLLVLLIVSNLGHFGLAFFAWAPRSLALCKIADNPHIAPSVLAGIAEDALADTGAVQYRARRNAAKSAAASATESVAGPNGEKAE
jgi:hypothetical protein